MIEVAQTSSDVVIVRLRGIAPPGAFERLAGALAFHPQRGCARVLFDWSKLDDWRVSASEPRLTNAWKDLAQSIRCAAIIHHPRWNRQAAWIAALLRLHNVRVRSWRRDEAERAIAWLESS